MDYLLTGLVAFFAGFVDSVVGGGGLIQLPALLIMFPAHPPAMLFGTNKFASIAGTAVALRRYSRSIEIKWRNIFPGAIAAFIGAFLGARTVTLINPALLRPAIIVVLIHVAVYTFIKKDLGAIHLPKLSPHKEKLYGVMAGGVIGFYDGFFGPGTGSFLILVFVSIYGFDFLSATASAKVINLATNIASIIYFIYSSNVMYRYAVPMAVCNVFGSVFGTAMAMKRGSKFIRVFFLFVVSGLILKLLDLLSW